MNTHPTCRCQQVSMSVSEPTPQWIHPLLQLELPKMSLLMQGPSPKLAWITAGQTTVRAVCGRGGGNDGTNALHCAYYSKQQCCMQALTVVGCVCLFVYVCVRVCVCMCACTCGGLHCVCMCCDNSIHTKIHLIFMFSVSLRIPVVMYIG